jgi:hypothetical protein
MPISNTIGDREALQRDYRLPIVFGLVECGVIPKNHRHTE